MPSGPQIENYPSKVLGAEINDENQNANVETVAILKEKDRSRGVEELPTPQRQRIDDEPFQRNQNGSVSEKLDFNHQVSMQELKNSKATLETLLNCTQNDDVRADCKIQIGHLQAEIVAKESQIAIDNPNTQPIQPDNFFIAQPLECIDDAGSAKDGEVHVELLEVLLNCAQNDDVRADSKIQIGHLQAEIVAKESQIAIDNPNTQPIQPDNFFIAQPLECIDDAGSAKDGEVPVALDAGDGGSECDAGKMDARAIRLGAPAADILCNASPITPSESDGLIGHVDVINQGGAACLSRPEMPKSIYLGAPVYSIFVGERTQAVRIPGLHCIIAINSLRPLPSPAPQIKAVNPGISKKEITLKLGEQWRALSDAQQETYKMRAKALKN